MYICWIEPGGGIKESWLDKLAKAKRLKIPLSIFGTWLIAFHNSKSRGLTLRTHPLSAEIWGEGGMKGIVEGKEKRAPALSYLKLSTRQQTVRQPGW